MDSQHGVWRVAHLHNKKPVVSWSLRRWNETSLGCGAPQRNESSRSHIRGTWLRRSSLAAERSAPSCESRYPHSFLPDTRPQQLGEAVRLTAPRTSCSPGRISPDDRSQQLIPPGSTLPWRSQEGHCCVCQEGGVERSAMTFHHTLVAGVAGNTSQTN